ncbi:MAG: DNA polymerase III subunit gamma/tau [Synergistaceae bacterium]|nr:DNA polymerase III subunit gamma/tau [Synergistaceae bacterium]
MHVSLYRKYRPQIFKDVVGQDAAVNLLRQSLIDKRLGHAYLFSGPRGCGKTTAARLLAKAVNCDNPAGDGEPCCACESCTSITSGGHMDVMEIDGASNRGIDQIRELKSHVGLASFTGGTKVYILDEVHMLTAEAFNALLKTLEEPPPSVLFIFATTEPHKVPVTIRSRCQHIPFRRISSEDMVTQLRRVAASESFEADEGALWEIARSADGALRDALSLAEQAVAAGEGWLSLEAVQDLFGGGSRMEMERFVSLFRTSPREASEAIRGMLGKGVSPERFLDALFPLLKDMWAFALWGEPSLAGTSLSDEEKNFLRSEAPRWDAWRLRRAAMTCASLFPRARMGLRSEIFSGMLFFELSSIFQDEGPAQTMRAIAGEGGGAAAAGMEADSSPQPPSRPMRAAREDRPGIGRGQPSAATPQMGGAREKIPPADAAEPGERAGELPPALAALCEDNLPMAAAMVCVRATLSESGLAFDFSEASSAAKAVLTSPRAKFALERAFGIREGRAETKDTLYSSAPEGAGDGPPAPMTPRAMTAEAISAYLGADILMSKQVVSDENMEDPADTTDL